MVCRANQPTEGTPRPKCAREVMEILEAYDLTQCAHLAAPLVGCG
ncbi:Transposase (plasmid) [Rhodococcus sp. WAY2]|nr:Transposase [Rhodococcus sp. WAY2]